MTKKVWVQAQIDKGGIIEDAIAQACTAHERRTNGKKANVVLINPCHPQSVTSPEGVTIIRSDEVHSTIEAWAGRAIIQRSVDPNYFCILEGDPGGGE